SCAGRGRACSDCLVSVLFDSPPELAGLTADEQRAIEVFARAGFDVEVLPTTVAPPPTRAARVRRARRRAA
ncbi:MAG TPA: hypothetical protein VGD43_07120, partial [Micromonospora sp.]